jgi:hypothetical protein
MDSFAAPLEGELFPLGGRFQSPVYYYDSLPSEDSSSMTGHHTCRRVRLPSSSSSITGLLYFFPPEIAPPFSLLGWILY